MSQKVKKFNLEKVLCVARYREELRICLRKACKMISYSIGMKPI